MLRTGCVQKPRAKLGQGWSCCSTPSMAAFPSAAIRVILLPSFHPSPIFPGLHLQQQQGRRPRLPEHAGMGGRAKNFCVYPAQLFPEFLQPFPISSTPGKIGLGFLQLWLCPGKSSSAACAGAEEGKVEGAERQLYIQYTHSNLLLWKTICFSVLQSSEGKL